MTPVVYGAVKGNEFFVETHGTDRSDLDRPNRQDTMVRVWVWT